MPRRGLSLGDDVGHAFSLALGLLPFMVLFWALGLGVSGCAASALIIKP